MGDITSCLESDFSFLKNETFGLYELGSVLNGLDFLIFPLSIDSKVLVF